MFRLPPTICHFYRRPYTRRSCEAGARCGRSQSDKTGQSIYSFLCLACDEQLSADWLYGTSCMISRNSTWWIAFRWGVVTWAAALLSHHLETDLRTTLSLPSMTNSIYNTTQPMRRHSLSSSCSLLSSTTADSYDIGLRSDQGRGQGSDPGPTDWEASSGPLQSPHTRDGDSSLRSCLVRHYSHSLIRACELCVTAL